VRTLIVQAAIAVPIGVQGIPLASHFHQWESGTLHAELALVAVVAGLVVWHLRRPAAHALDGVIFIGRWRSRIAGGLVRLRGLHLWGGP
jgi:thiamine transporter ThiT